MRRLFPDSERPPCTGWVRQQRVGEHDGPVHPLVTSGMTVTEKIINWLIC
jgi:hypothetical protein